MAITSQDTLIAARATKTRALAFRRLADSACAYTLFFWAALYLIGLPLVTPDMAVALLLFVAAALTSTLTFAGITTGCFPILDIAKP